MRINIAYGIKFSVVLKLKSNIILMNVVKPSSTKQIQLMDGKQIYNILYLN